MFGTSVVPWEIFSPTLTGSPWVPVSTVPVRIRPSVTRLVPNVPVRISSSRVAVCRRVPGPTSAGPCPWFPRRSPPRLVPTLSPREALYEALPVPPHRPPRYPHLTPTAVTVLGAGSGSPPKHLFALDPRRFSPETPPPALLDDGTPGAPECPTRGVLFVRPPAPVRGETGPTPVPWTLTQPHSPPRRPGTSSQVPSRVRVPIRDSTPLSVPSLSDLRPSGPLPDLSPCPQIWVGGGRWGDHRLFPEGVPGVLNQTQGVTRDQ